MREKEAYEMMFRFLEERYMRLPSDALGGLLGEMQLNDDGLPFDPAIVKEWESAVDAARLE
jgi:hypothetical protein